MKKIISSIIVMTLLVAVIVVPIFFVFALYSSGLVYFGITYEKMSDLVLFVIISTVLGGILELILKTLVQASFDLKLINKIQTKAFTILFDFITSMVSLLVVDFFMEDITLSVKAILLFSLFNIGISSFISNDKESVSDEKIDLALENEVQMLLSENNLFDTINLLREEHPELSMTQIKKTVQQINK